MQWQWQRQLRRSSTTRKAQARDGPRRLTRDGGLPRVPVGRRRRRRSSRVDSAQARRERRRETQRDAERRRETERDGGLGGESGGRAARPAGKSRARGCRTPRSMEERTRRYFVRGMFWKKAWDHWDEAEDARSRRRAGTGGCRPVTAQEPRLDRPAVEHGPRKAHCTLGRSGQPPTNLPIQVAPVAAGSHSAPCLAASLHSMQMAFSLLLSHSYCPQSGPQANAANPSIHDSMSRFVQ